MNTTIWLRAVWDKRLKLIIMKSINCSLIKKACWTHSRSLRKYLRQFSSWKLHCYCWYFGEDHYSNATQGLFCLLFSAYFTRPAKYNLFSNIGNKKQNTQSIYILIYELQRQTFFLCVHFSIARPHWLFYIERLLYKWFCKPQQKCFDEY